MAVGSRHIRHDYNTWVDWEQKSVRTLCGVTTRTHLAGIPGLTQQPSIVQLPDRKVWGWCMRCVCSAYSPISNNSVASDVDSRVQSLYTDALAAIQEQYLWYRDRMQRDRENRNRL